MAPLEFLDWPVEDGMVHAEVIDDAEFDIDLRVVESASRVAAVSCDTSDGCGNTCEGSACTSFSNDPY